MNRPSQGPVLFLFAILCLTPVAKAADGYPHPKENPGASLMLQGTWVPEDTHTIDFDKLPRIPSKHAVVSDARPRNGVNQHNYLTYYDGQYWVMWSDGPAVED